jgi:dihydrofolate reductase
MGRIVVVENLSLDGVMQSPARADEDRRGGFTLGGWAVPYMDQVAAAAMGKRMTRPGAMLLGRKTYEDFFEIWPNRKDNPYTDALNRTTKYVASRTLKEPLPWMNSILVKGDAERTVPALKAAVDGDLAVLGSGELVRTLLQHDLVDELLLSIAPLTLGAGKRLFPDQSVSAKFELVESVPTTTGVIIATYRRL